MNSKGIVALEDTTLCMKCLKKKATHTYRISGRGYGSIYDNFNSEFHLCDDCAKEEYHEWASECGEWDEDYFCGEDYKYEKNLSNLIKSFPLEGQELFYNRFVHGACANYNMKPQDWIDFKLDELPHKKCKQYGFYSPQEIAAYKERFPNCACVVIDKYKDGSQGSSCPRGVHGDKDGNTGLNIYSQCYMCAQYKPREGDIKVIDKVAEYYKDEKDRLIHMLQYASTRLRELENGVEEYINKHDK